MRGSDDFPDAEELAERVEQLEAENERLRERIQAVRAVCNGEAPDVVLTEDAGGPSIYVSDVIAALDGDA